MPHFGVDVSHHNGTVDWKAVRDSGRPFAFCKATQGIGFKDPRLDANRSAMRGVGLELIGLYHFAGSHISSQNPGQLHPWDKEAQFFLDAVGGLGDQEVAVLDFEQAYGRRPADLVGWAISWLQRVEEATGRRPIFYTFAGFLQSSLGSDQRLKSWPLWIARYGPNDGNVHSVDSPWPWALHQYTSNAAVPGVPGPCDDNRFEGTIEDLRRLVRGSAPSDDLDALRGKMRIFQFGDGWYKTDGVFRSHITTPGVPEFYRRANIPLLSPENNGVIQADVFDDLIDADALRK